MGALLFGIAAEVRDLQADADAPPELVAKLREVEARVAETAAAFRESLAVLDDVTPDQSLTATLRGRLRGVRAAHRAAGARCVALTDLPQLDAARCAGIVAVVREALVNVEKHAQAASVVVSLVASGDGLTVAVADDGLGWADAPAPGTDPLPRLRAARRRSAGDAQRRQLQRHRAQARPTTASPGWAARCRSSATRTAGSPSAMWVPVT